MNASISCSYFQGNNGRERRWQMEITQDMEDERPSCSIVLGLLVDSPWKPIIAVRQEANYMQPFHPLAKKIKCLYIWAGCRFFDKIFCQKMLASHLFAVLADGLLGSSSVFPDGISDKSDILDWKSESLSWSASLFCIHSHWIKCMEAEELHFRSSGL